MLLQIDLAAKTAERMSRKKLRDFALDERALQDILFKSLDRLLPDGDLLLITQSVRGGEEPDLIAVDKQGRLYLFELKVWESTSENLLQVLRYGQLFGSYRYEDLDRLYQRTTKSPVRLQEAHWRKFGSELDEVDFNNDQVFIVMTNGLDSRTREAIQYWKTRKLDVRPWVYRVYGGPAGAPLIEINPFGMGQDAPYEDIEEGYYIWNTNINNDRTDDADMMAQGKAAAYLEPWKRKVERLKKGDVVMLYRSGEGIVGVGTATGVVGRTAYHDNPEQADDEFYTKLTNFKRIAPPVSAPEIKEITGIKYFFGTTMFSIDEERGKKLVAEVRQRSNQGED
jgi:hypothetical protein